MSSQTGIGDPVGFPFPTVLRFADLQFLCARCSVVLLECMSQFVGQQPLACRQSRHVSSSGKDDVVADRVREGTHRSRGLPCSLVGVNADATEVMVEAWFKE